MIETEIFNREALCIIINHNHPLMPKGASLIFFGSDGSSSNADLRPSGSNMSGALNLNFVGSDKAVGA